MLDLQIQIDDLKVKVLDLKKTVDAVFDADLRERYIQDATKQAQTIVQNAIKAAVEIRDNANKHSLADDRPLWRITFSLPKIDKAIASIRGNSEKEYLRELYQHVAEEYAVPSTEITVLEVVPV